MKHIMRIAAVGAILIAAGCVSLEDRLASSDPQVKLAAERELIRHSRAEGTESERIAAVNRITDKKLLCEIAMQAKSGQWVAEDPSFDEKAGYNGFEKSKDGKVRTYYKLSSRGKLSDYTRVSGRTIDTTKEGVAAVERLGLDETRKEDFVKLFDLIRKAESDQVKLAAFKCIKDPKRSQAMAPHLARATSDTNVQTEALAKLDPEKRLATVALSSSDAKTRMDAFNKLKDQKAIDDVVLKTTDNAILIAGMSKVSDKTALASRIFSKEVVSGTEPINVDVVLAYLKTTSANRQELWKELASRDMLERIETVLARLYRDKYQSLSDDSRNTIISSITMPKVVAKMVVPSIMSPDEKRKVEHHEEDVTKAVASFRFMLSTALKVQRRVLKGEKEDHNCWSWLEYQTPDLTDEERELCKKWEFGNDETGELNTELNDAKGFCAMIKRIETALKKNQCEMDRIISNKKESLYIENDAARSLVVSKMSPEIIDKVFPFQGILGMKLGEKVATTGGRYDYGAQGVAPGSIRVPFTPKRGLPQFSLYWYRASVRSHRVFMIEAKTDAPLEGNQFDNLVKSLEKKYGQTPDKWKGEGMDVGDAVGDIKTFFVTRYTFNFPGNRRLVVEDRARRFGGGLMDEVIMSQSVDKKKRGYVSLVAYDDNVKKVANAEMEAAMREQKQRKEKKSKDAAQAISDAL